MIKQSDAIQLLKSLPDKSVDLIFVDPPYALGSEVIIRADGKPDYKKAVDFMNKWDQPDGKFWEEWFKEANRVLKYGGRVLMFGMDRQLMLNKYYACFAGLQEQQSLYWYFASSFPKSSDLSKNLDKYFGEEREVVGKNPNGFGLNTGICSLKGLEANPDITKPSSPLAQKYDGFKYSISPVKQTNETIMVFQKPYKTGSAMHDTLAYENGDGECCCGALNIDDNRIPSNNEELRRNAKGGDNGLVGTSHFKIRERKVEDKEFVTGRFPAQSFVDSETAKLLDEQSGISKSSGGSGDKSMEGIGKNGIYNSYASGVKRTNSGGLGDIGGCSKILHKCDYDEKDIELYYYCPKVDKKERNMGMDDFPDIDRERRGNNQAVRYCSECNKTFNHINDHSNCNGSVEYRQSSPLKNNHPTVKPISLLLKILNLFKTPNPQVCVDAFAGSGSIPIAAELLGFEVIAGDLDEEFVKIANARLDYAIKNKEKLNTKYKDVINNILPKKDTHHHNFF